MGHPFMSVMFIFAIIFFIDSVNTKALGKQRVLKVFNDSECLYTYTAVQPNLDVVKEKVAEFIGDRCALEKRKQSNWLERQKQRKKLMRRRMRMRKRQNVKSKATHKEKKKHIRKVRPRTKTLRGRRVKTKRLNKFHKRKVEKYFDQLKQFKRWKMTNSRKTRTGENEKYGRKGQKASKMPFNKKYDLPMHSHH